LPLREGHACQASAHILSEGCDAGSAVGVARRLQVDLGQATLELRDAVLQRTLAGLQRFQGESAGLVGVNQSPQLLPQLGHLRVGAHLDALGAEVGDAGLHDQVGMLQMTDDLLPDKFVELVRPTSRLSATEPLRSHVQGHWVSTRVVAIHSAVVVIRGRRGASLAALTATN
jgi:hypothetical protein